MKQVIVVNESLVLPTGKLAAQVAHAAVAAFLHADRAAQEAWLNQGMPKIVLAASSETQLQELQKQAAAADIPVAPIHDAGRTVVAAGTLTCVGFGPPHPPISTKSPAPCPCSDSCPNTARGLCCPCRFGFLETGDKR